MAYVTSPAQVHAGQCAGSTPQDVPILDRLDMTRLLISEADSHGDRAALGQFFTPAPVARLMAAMLAGVDDDLHILDAGAGIGTLFAAGVIELAGRATRPSRISVTAYEVDESLIGHLECTLEVCRQICDQSGIRFVGRIVKSDFIETAVSLLAGGLFGSGERPQFNCAILNPPYRKIRSDSRERKLLRHLGIETSNLYTGFVGAAIQMLQPGGELVAITPRSFCNGPYFRPFRELLLSQMRLRRLHLFESRELTFKDDEVLQENIVLHAVKTTTRDETPVLVTVSGGPDDEYFTSRALTYEQVVRPDDKQALIHIVPDALEQRLAERMAALPATLGELGLSVSTGRVVDFRARDFLRQEPDPGTAPLIYPAHFSGGAISWPRKDIRKPNALAISTKTADLLVPSEHYVLVKRFTSKEERRRVTAAVYDPGWVPCERVGFENHLNYFHRGGRGLEPVVAHGLSAFLNSTLVDSYFRQFNGHTQVNATDLRSLRYPALSLLTALGSLTEVGIADQAMLDRAVEEVLFGMSDEHASDPVQAKRRIEEAQKILKALGMPAGHQNERSALTLLALLDLRPETPWSQASNPLRGITPMMEFFREHYGKQYAPNTRETVRRGTMHQFVEAALAVVNPDNPGRPTNSGQTVYQIEPAALKLLRSYGAPDWDERLRSYIAQTGTLQANNGALPF